MAEYIQLELFDLKPYTSGEAFPEIYVLEQVRNPSGTEGVQLELNLYPDVPHETYFNVKQAA